MHRLANMKIGKKLALVSGRQHFTARLRLPGWLCGR